MTNVRKSGLSTNKRSKTSRRRQKSAKKTRRGSRNVQTPRDDSSVYSSYSESSSCETTEDGCDSKSRGGTELVDSNNFEERAKRFLETMPTERRKEWLGQQGYTYSKDGLLVPFTEVGQTSSSTVNVLKNKHRRRRFDHSCGFENGAYGSGDENHSHAVEREGERGQHSETQSESESSTSHDLVSVSSDAEQNGFLTDNKSAVGNYRQLADITERPANESPNAVIKNRYARLMARMSDVGGGFPEIGDMEITTAYEENFGGESETSTNELKHNNINTGKIQGQLLGVREMTVGKRAEDEVECIQSEVSTVQLDEVKCLTNHDGNVAKIHLEKKVDGQDINIDGASTITLATSKYSEGSDLSSKLNEAYKPVIEGAVVCVLREVDSAHKTNCFPNPDKRFNHDIKRKTVKIDAKRDNNTTPCTRDPLSSTKGEASVKNRCDRSEGNVSGNHNNMTTANDSGTIRSDSKGEGQISEGSRPAQEPNEMQRTVHHECEGKDTPLQKCEGKITPDNKSISVECEDALVTFKSQPCENDQERMGTSNVTAAKNSTCYKHRLDGENFRNVNDNFQDYNKRLKYQTRCGLTDTGEPSEEEIRLASLRKLVDKKLVKNVLRNSQYNAEQSCGTRVHTNNSDLCIAESRNKQGGEDRKRNESNSASPCFVTGNKMNVSKKLPCNKVPMVVPVPVPRTKVSSAQPSSGKSSMTNNNQVKVDKCKIKRDVTCERLEMIPETSSVSSCQSSDTGNGQSKCRQKTDQISRAIKAPAIIRRPKLPNEKLVVGLESFGNECPVQNSQQESPSKDKQALNIHSASAHTAIMNSKQANKAEKKKAKIQLPLIKATTNKPKIGLETTANASFKLPKIKTEENQRLGEQAKVCKEPSLSSKTRPDKGFLPPVSKSTKANASVVHKNTPMHLPNVHQTAMESTHGKGGSNRHNANQNNIMKYSLKPSALHLSNLTSNQCGEQESITNQAPRRKLPEIANRQQGTLEVNDPKKDVKVSSKPCDTNDTKIKQGFNQIEFEIQREIETQLKQAKQNKSTPPNRYMTKALSIEEKSMVNAKMDALDELCEDDGEGDEDDDEREFLSSIVSSDCRLTMYGHTKDAPLIRKTEASALDKMKETLGVGEVSRKGKVKNYDEDDTSTSFEDRRLHKKKIPYNDFKNQALRTAKQKALLTMARGSLEDTGEGTSPDSDVMLNKSSNALVFRDKQTHVVGSNVLLGDNRKKELISNVYQSKHRLPPTLVEVDKFAVDVLIMDESSYGHYGNSSRCCCSTLSQHNLFEFSLDFTEERNTNANNSKGGSDGEENCAPNQDLPDGANSIIIDREKKNCFTSSPNASNELQTRGSKKDTARNSRIPVRAAARKNYEQNKCSNHVTRLKSVTFQCDKIPQRLVVILNNKDGRKVGQAEAQIIFTDGEAIRLSNQASGSTNRDESYTVEIRGESTEPTHPVASPSNFEEDEWRKLPLSERLKKYQKSKPRNIHSGTFHKPDRALSADVKPRMHNSTGQQNIKPSNVGKTVLCKRNGLEQTATDDKVRDPRGTPKQTHHDIVNNMPMQSSVSPKRNQHKALLRPDISPQADNINRSTNLMSQCELFSASLSLRTTQDDEDDLPTAEVIAALKVSSVSNNFTKGQSSQPNVTSGKTNRTHQEFTGVGRHRNSSVVDYSRSPHNSAAVNSNKQVKNPSSVDYEPTLDVDDSLQLFLHHEQALAEVQTPMAQLEREDPVSDENREEEDDHRDTATPGSEDNEAAVDDDLGQQSTERNVTRSPTFSAGEQREEYMGGSSPKQSKYRDSLACTPLQHPFSEDEGKEEAQSNYLQLIYKKVKHHFFERLKDDPHNSQGKHSITEEDGGSNETQSVNMSQEELSRKEENIGTPSELGDEDSVGEMSYDEKTRHSFHSNDDSMENTYSIANEKQATDEADTKATDIENNLISDVTANENHQLNTPINSATNSKKRATQMRHKNHMDPKQIVLKKMATGFAPKPAISSPIRSKQAKRPKGNLFDKMALTSDESLVENTSADRYSKYAAPIIDANKNDLRISKEKDAVCDEHCSIEKRRSETKPDSSRVLINNHEAFNKGSRVSEKSSHKSAVGPRSISPSDHRSVSASSLSQLNPCLRPPASSAKLATRAYSYSPVKGKNLPEDAESPGEIRGSNASHPEFSPWPQDKNTREEGMAATLSSTRPANDGNNDIESSAGKKKTNSQPKPETLPPLSNRQTGLPHRPKVKRYY